MCIGGGMEILILELHFFFNPVEGLNHTKNKGEKMCLCVGQRFHINGMKKKNGKLICIKIKTIGLEMTQGLESLAALSDDPGSILSTHISGHNHL